MPDQALPGPPPLRVLVADDNPVVRAGLTALLGGHPDIEVVAAAADGDEALASPPASPRTSYSSTSACPAPTA